VIASARTQAARSEATIGALLTAARELFASDGFAAASIDAVAAKAGMTKGAVYHHFSGKRDLFAAVFAAEQERMLEATVAAVGAESDSWRAFETACRAFLQACLEPGLQRIFLLDAQAALGWEKVRELEHSSLEAMELAIKQAVQDGRIGERPPEPLASMLFGLLCESAMVVARADDQLTAHAEALAELHRLFAALAA
jgi:AcrR family transcriptional regulator